jgi:hypothetical protein
MRESNPIFKVTGFRESLTMISAQVLQLSFFHRAKDRSRFEASKGQAHILF